MWLKTRFVSPTLSVGNDVPVKQCFTPRSSVKLIDSEGLNEMKVLASLMISWLIQVRPSPIPYCSALLNLSVSPKRRYKKVRILPICTRLRESKQTFPECTAVSRAIPIRRFPRLSFPLFSAPHPFIASALTHVHTHSQPTLCFHWYKLYMGSKWSINIVNCCRISVTERSLY